MEKPFTTTRELIINRSLPRFEEQTIGATTKETWVLVSRLILPDRELSIPRDSKYLTEGIDLTRTEPIRILSRQRMNNSRSKISSVRYLEQETAFDSVYLKREISMQRT